MPKVAGAKGPGARTFTFMSESKPQSKTPSKAQALSLAQLAILLGDESRWKLLRELGKGQPLPVKELAARISRSPSGTSKHLSVMRKVRAVTVGFGRLYSLAPAFRPAPGTAVIDFGYGVVRLDGPPG